MLTFMPILLYFSQNLRKILRLELALSCSISEIRLPVQVANLELLCSTYNAMQQSALGLQLPLFAVKIAAAEAILEKGVQVIYKTLLVAAYCSKLPAAATALALICVTRICCRCGRALHGTLITLTTTSWRPPAQ